jgi:hypothetical protein
MKTIYIFISLFLLGACSNDSKEIKSSPIDDGVISSEMIDIPTDETTQDAIKEHCKMMPEMSGCEKYK